ncbi:hypothetical protein [Bdellovibrio bacteriovorus]|uniref:Uncharacterized protein n=1 Tax=Bdellovibrio bacteriovorus TaxID=959 RepID=A0A1Z3N6R5_BDEBC|nr:hypothetical protein [Bdellovibrio bacteriovorus]ASD63139.1 hypothetical protein B9G79_05945 [Bdellovibrio bacteriovorus]
MKLLKSLPVLIAFLILIGCGPQPRNHHIDFDYDQAFLTETRRNIPDNLALGRSYNVLTGDVGRECATGTKTPQGELVLKNSLNRNLSPDQVYELLGFNQGQYPNQKTFFSGSSVDRFLLPPKESFRRIFFYSLSLRGLTLKLDQVKLSQKDCQQAYIESQNLGADILVKVDMYFQNRQAADLFESQADGSSLKSLFRVLRQHKNLDGFMVSALQWGGDPQQFIKFTANELNGLAQCNMQADLNACAEIYESLTSYALNKQTGLLQQVLAGGASSSIVSFNWKELKSPLFTQQEEQALQQLKVLSEAYRKLQVTSGQMESWQSIVSVPGAYREIWDKAKENINQAKIQIEDQVLACFQNLQTCEINLRQDAVAFPKIPTFMYWCQNSSDKVFQTLTDKFAGSCGAAFLYLNESPRLDLSKMEIEHLDFLENLPEKEVINLKRNNISDLTALQTVAGVGTLDLSENSVGDWEAVAAIQGLKNLVVSESDFLLSVAAEKCPDYKVWARGRILEPPCAN